MPIEPLNLPSAWTAAQLKEHPDWIYVLSEAELKEIDTSLQKVQSLSYDQLTQDSFPLPLLAKQIKAQFLEQLENGIGALLIRGIPIDKYSTIALEKILYGIGLYFGTTVSQSVKGETLHHVYDHGYGQDHPKTRGTNTAFGIVMHNDRCDVPALMCVRKAKSGGMSKLVSSVAIHNTMLTIDPMLVEALYNPYYMLRVKVDTALGKDWYAKPIFNQVDGHFSCNILRKYIDLAQGHKDIPTMTPLQIKALDVFDELASSKALCHYYMLEPGDILFANSYTTLHAREAFEDSGDLNQKRLLLRLWLSVANSRPLPESFRVVYHDVCAGAVRGGILPKESCNK